MGDDDVEWVELVDDQSGRLYFQNRTTGATSWELPTPSHGHDDHAEYDQHGHHRHQYSGDDFATPLPSNRFKSAQFHSRVSVVDRFKPDVDELNDTFVVVDDDDDTGLVGAVAELDLKLADQFEFSDDEEDDDTKAATMSIRERRLDSMTVSYGASAAATLSSMTIDASDVLNFGSKLKVLVGNVWDGAQLSTIPLPSWPRPPLTSCQEEATTYPLADYITAHFNPRKTWFGSSSSPTDDASLLRHSKSKMKTPLTKILSGSAYEPVRGIVGQMSKNILSYMGDRKSSKGALGHSARIISTGIQSGEAICNEIYLLLVKQTTLNPSGKSLALGWKLMLCCCSTFGPGEELACYLRSLFHQRLLDQDQDQTISDLVVACIHSLELTMQRGRRLCCPLQEELVAIQDMVPIVVRVHLLHGESIQVAVHSQTTVDDVLNVCCEFFETDKDEAICVHEAIFDAGGARIFIPLNSSDRILDLTTGRPQRRQFILDAIGASLLPTADTDLQFVFRLRMIAGEAFEEPRLKGGTRSMMYIEAFDSIVHGRHRLSNTDCIEMASLLLPGIVDCCRAPSLLDVIGANLDKLLSPQIRLEVFEGELIRRIETQIRRRGDIPPPARARRVFWDEIQHLPTFGANFFYADQLRTTKKGHNLSEPIIMGISRRGLLLLHHATYEMSRGVTIPELLTYGIKDDRILMVVGTPIRFDKLVFSSWQTDHIDKALRLCCRQSPAIMALGNGS